MATPAMLPPNCVICGQAQRAWIDQSLWQCPACGHLSAPERLNELPLTTGSLDESQRSMGLSPLRRRNAEDCLAALRKHTDGRSVTICDVGCGPGWFGTFAQSRGIDVLAIEPDQAMVETARASGLNVRPGAFPDCLRPDERFDALVFNDVWEHLSDARGMAKACELHLDRDGVLLITLPSRQGALFRLATLAWQMGMRGPMDRLWQKGFPSPHLHYYSPPGLARLMKSCGFDLVEQRAMASFQLRGLWSRLRMDSRLSLTQSLTTWSVLAALLPFHSTMPSDSVLQVFRRQA